MLQCMGNWKKICTRKYVCYLNIDIAPFMSHSKTPTARMHDVTVQFESQDHQQLNEA